MSDPTSTTLIPARDPELEEETARWKVAKHAARSSWVPPQLRGKTEEVYMILLAGQGLGLNPAQTLKSVHYIAGTITFSAELQRALILAAGHRLEVTEYGDDLVTIRGVRTDGSSLAVSWDMERAQRAGLLQRNSDSWRKYPRAMLAARATSELGRMLFADCLVGIASYNEYETADVLQASYEDLQSAPADLQRDLDLDEQVAEIVSEDDKADAEWVAQAKREVEEDNKESEDD